jgi:hypothetical protein
VDKVSFVVLRSKLFSRSCVAGLHRILHRWRFSAACSNQGWLSQSSYCTWYGVTCNGADEPEMIQLRNNNMVGEIPVEIGVLNGSLKYLYVRELWLCLAAGSSFAANSVPAGI